MKLSSRCRPRSLEELRGTLRSQGRGRSSTRMGELEAAGRRLGLGRTRPTTVARTSPMESKRRLMVRMEGLRDQMMEWRLECCSCSASDA